MKSCIFFVRGETISMSYNVQPLRTQQEINDFLFCLRRNKNAERDVFLFLIGINSGLRMSDIVKLKKKDVISSKNPRIVEQKTGKTRILYLSSLQELIQDYTKDLKPEDYLFPSTKGGHLEVNTVYQMFQKVAALLDRDDIGTHTLRKTFGYHYYKKTKDVATLMEIFGHSSEKITKRYIGINEDEISETLLNFRLGF
ncbi:putative integrase/recombinase YoeC [Dellaglioa algida]|jgi:integrase|uniref:Bacteriophage integrase n=7 Tax=Lactobacillales TaxID=186826 RepID=A0A0R1HFR6_9LACO|nr:bacteriophage integrase [Dellaglioa algida DSM 15638]SOB52242.1 putative integrase/recombinase YoeC [Dellaglioa algida]